MNDPQFPAALRQKSRESSGDTAPDLGRHFRDGAVRADPPPAGYLVRKLARRPRRALLSGAVAVVALLVGLTAAADSEDDSDLRQAPDLVQQPEKLVGIEDLDWRDQGGIHLARITAEPWAREWKGATLSEIRVVEQKPDLAHPTGLPPAWHAKVTAASGETGYLLWDAGGAGELIEFCLDADLQVGGPNAKAVTGVPPLQQFPVEGEDGKAVASGCVPTAAASVLGYWIAHGHPQWAGAAKDDLEGIAKRLRARLAMRVIPDTDGFTANGMALAGAMPQDLARAMQADADARRVPVTCAIERFSLRSLRSEIDAGRPVLLSCRVRVPHKPELSWGHEVAGVAWCRIGPTTYAGVLDNFFPTENPGAIRWVHPDAFRSLITVREAPGE